MKLEWPAHYLDGQTAIRHPATVRLGRQGLEITTAAGWTRSWRYRDVRQTRGFYEGEEVRLERGGELPEVLLVADLAFLVSLHEAAPEVSARFHHPARRSWRVPLTILAGVAAVALIVALYLWGIPGLAALVAPRVPVAWEESLGRSAAEYLAPPDRRCDDPRLLQVVDGLVARLTAGGPPAPYTFRVYVVDRPVVNALAAPGGYVVIFRGLLRRSGSPEELAGVLAHELQHVLRRHATRAIIQRASTGLLLAALTGDVTGPLAYGLETARTLGELRYSRQAEEEADVEGMRMVLRARIEPAGMLAFFERMRTEGAEPDLLRYLSTHPSTEERVARLRAMAQASGARPVPLLPGADWSGLRSLCRAGGR